VVLSARRSLKLLLDLVNEILESREVVEMRSIFLDFFPQLLNGIVIRGVGWQWVDGESLFMFFEELLHRFAGVISGSILDEDDMFCNFGKNGFQELRVAFRCQTPFLTLIKETPSEVVDQTNSRFRSRISTRPGTQLSSPTC
jgi:hypothetical protein